VGKTHLRGRVLQIHIHRVLQLIFDGGTQFPVQFRDTMMNTWDFWRKSTKWMTKWFGSTRVMIFCNCVSSYWSLPDVFSVESPSNENGSVA
jgi:hypothetical protein